MPVVGWSFCGVNLLADPSFTCSRRPLPLWLSEPPTQVSLAPVAQLDRASDYGSGGWGFESLRACGSIGFRLLDRCQVVAGLLTRGKPSVLVRETLPQHACFLGCRTPRTFVTPLWNPYRSNSQWLMHPSDGQRRRISDATSLRRSIDGALLL